MAAQPNDLQADGGHESRVIDEISFPQTPRLLAQPVSPLESRIFDPLRSVF